MLIPHLSIPCPLAMICFYIQEHSAKEKQEVLPDVEVDFKHTQPEFSL
jgi:hypothetical protein